MVPLIGGGELVTTRVAPVLAGRGGRLAVTLASFGDEPRDVIVRLELATATGSNARAIDQSVALAGDRTEVAIELDASALDPSDTFAISVIEAPGFSSRHDVSIGARVPDAGMLALDARPAPTFRVLVVPTGPTPLIFDAARVEPWRAALAAMLPVRDVEIRIAEPLVSTRDITKDSDWPLMLGDLAAWRAGANVDPDVFVYGVVPLNERANVGGMAATLAVEVPYWRVAAGQATGRPDEAFIVAHELGHSLGRSHAPCGNPGGPDYAYPYAKASIGVPGLDARDPSMLVDPKTTFDILSYCMPVFVSDYGFGAAFRSLTALGERRASAVTDPGIVVDPMWLP